MAGEGAQVLELVLDRRTQVCRQQEHPDFGHERTRRGTAAEPRENPGWVEKGQGQALDKGAYIQRVLTVKPRGALRERKPDASLVFGENG